MQIVHAVLAKTNSGYLNGAKIPSIGDAPPPKYAHDTCQLYLVAEYSELARIVSEEIKAEHMLYILFI